ncbi:Lrp/AsnC family transcriptional regulator [Ornithinimicrobium sediminis]|uniref:Lrp/AsnC family transcriptional regulator n=1 Tax=Ornithinimicrobium sediminis TaxID=2904603 RepID=UPI001E331504|nr:Lrp/AsnC family transcriptional regulator [Ornithinimicrobium sediminis]MCE0485468.1 Lrp/AsnC family transcriptional regulator [Ornithinimicrobium sediminis]
MVTGSPTGSRAHSPIAARPGEVLDQVDRQLVAALQVAPRASWQQISTAMGVSESTVSRRAKRLFASGSVRVTAMPDPLRCGLGFPVLMQVSCAVGAADSVARALALRPDVRFVALLSGNFDLVLETVVPSRSHLSDVLLNDVDHIPGIVRTTTEAVIRNFKTSYDWGRSLLGDGVERLEQARPAISAVDGTHPVDADDMQLISLLGHDGRLSAAELAKHSDLSESSIRRRIEALTTGAAVHFATFIDPVLMGFEAPVFIWLDVDLGHLEEVALALSSRVEVRYLSATAGYSDLIAEVILPDLHQLYGFLTQVIGPLPGVRRSEVGLELSTVKRGYLT